MPFRNPIVAGEELIIPGIRSKDWKESESGWRVGRDGSAQFNSLHILNNLNAENLSADRFVVGENGIWLPDGTEVGDRLDNLQETILNRTNPGFITGGIINSGGLPTGTPEVPRSTDVPTVIIQSGTYPTSGWYSVNLKHCLVRAQDTANANWYLTIQPRFTSANSPNTPADPTTSSPDLGEPTTHQGITTFFHMRDASTTYYVSESDVAAGRRDKILLVFRFYSGTSLSYADFGGNSNWFVSINYEGSGIYPKVGLSYANEIVEPPPEPETDYNVTFNPLWSQSYGANSADTSTFKVNFASCLQGGGYYGYHCRSLVGYDWAAIDSLLTGLNNAKMYLTYKVKHTYYSAGTPISVGHHTFLSAPNTWNGTDSAQSNLKVSELLQAGDSKTVDITDWIPAFRDGWPNHSKGITFGPKSGYVNYAYLYGATETGKPTIRITGRK